MVHTLVGIIVILLVIGVLIWAAQRILAVIPIGEPFKTVIYVLLVLIAVFLLLDVFGLLGDASLRLGRV